MSSFAIWLTSPANRAAWLFGAAGLLCSVGSAVAAGGEGAASPQLVVGDHWQYRITDNLRRGAVSQLDVEVVSVTGRSARIRFERVDADGRKEWIDEVDGEGGMVAGSLSGGPVRPFSPPVQLLAFPLAKGKTWRQTIDTVRKDTGVKDQILIYGKVNGSVATSVPAGTYDALSIYRTIQLDDAEFWRTRTARTDAIWYAPAVKASVREKHEAQYIQRDRGAGNVRTESTLLELVSFRAGAK